MQRPYASELGRLDKQLATALEDFVANEQEYRTALDHLQMIEDYRKTDRYRSRPQFHEKVEAVTRDTLQWRERFLAGMQAAKETALAIAGEYRQFPNARQAYEAALKKAEKVTAPWMDPRESQVRRMMSWQFVK